MYFVTLLIGLCLGILVSTSIFLTRKEYGTLKIDRSNPNKDIVRLDIGDLDRFTKKAKIVIRVDPNADFSQE